MWVLATTQFPWAVRVTKANPPTGSGGRVGCVIDVKTAPAGTITLNEWQGSMAKAAFTGTTLLSLELDELDFYGDMAAFYLPAFFALGGLAIALDTAAQPTVWLSIAFTLARVLHTLAYLLGVQPWRTLFYAIGAVCLLGFCALITASIGN